MAETLHNLLDRDDPVALGRIETRLDAEDQHNPTVDAILSALIWRRCTNGHQGVLGALIHRDCAARLDVLPKHLERVGAKDAANVMRDLRGMIPLEDDVIQNGIIDWIDENPTFISQAEELNDQVDDIGPTVWAYMQKRHGDLPDVEIPEKKKGFFSRFFGA